MFSVTLKASGFGSVWQSLGDADGHLTSVATDDDRNIKMQRGK